MVLWKMRKSNPEIDIQQLPKHIAIIMDGNGRWAKKRGLPRLSGHFIGAKRVAEIVTACKDLGVKVLSLYAFSTENWSRPRQEVSALMKLLETYLHNEMANMLRHDIRLVVSGILHDLPKNIQNLIKSISEKTSRNRTLILNLCINYGGRKEIIDGFKKYLGGMDGKVVAPGELTEAAFRQFLYHPDIPDVDLMIRTSGEERISNFLLWQLAYAELYFTPVLWPDFTKSDLYEAIKAYQQRERRFGGV